MHESVLVTIPAITSHVALLRAAGSALAARLDFPVDRITELQIAIDEVCGRLLAVSQSPTTIQMEFQAKEDAIAIRASADGPQRDDRELLSDWSRVILEAIATDVSPEGSDGRTTLSLQIARAAR
ncbi:MAG: ATP-binding protein [Actinomycetota bacterium]|nr:ATP-binding protein [Actinomycetota bacterium]